MSRETTATKFYLTALVSLTNLITKLTFRTVYFSQMGLSNQTFVQRTSSDTGITGLWLLA